MAPRFGASALAACALLFFGHPATAAGASGAMHSFDRELLAAADKLDAAAAHLRRAPHGRVTIPLLHLTPAPLGGAPMYSPSLDQWLQSSLWQIRNEHVRKTQAHDLTEVASSLRRAVVGSGAGIAPPLDPGAEAARILVERAYQTSGAGPAPAPHESFWERILRWMQEQINKLFARIFGAAASKPLIGQIVAVLFVALVAGAAIYLIYLLATSLVSKRRPPSHDEGAPLPEPIDPDALYQSGLAAAGAGLYARAVALLFAASLASFDRAGRLAFDASLTAGEYRRAVKRTHAPASPYFDAIAQAFIIAAFAERPISHAQWSAADAAYRSLRPLLAS